MREHRAERSRPRAPSPGRHPGSGTEERGRPEGEAKAAHWHGRTARRPRAARARQRDPHDDDRARHGRAAAGGSVLAQFDGILAAHRPRTTIPAGAGSRVRRGPPRAAAKDHPRTLGARSILADPRTTASSDALNQRIKHREPFRPFAPAILADHANVWFDLNVTSPFMLLAPPVRPDHADKIAGVVHVDGTARVQTVDPAVAPAYGALIEHFHQLTGVPVVLNTSFNDREPIVETPAHALATFQACDLDAACLGEYLVERS
ncbi:carbamoyltransferase C-terminal domain-containing protein [Streptomyces olivaceoviridis]